MAVIKNVPATIVDLGGRIIYMDSPVDPGEPNKSFFTVEATLDPIYKDEKGEIHKEGHTANEKNPNYLVSIRQKRSGRETIYREVIRNDEISGQYKFRDVAYKATDKAEKSTGIDLNQVRKTIDKIVN